VISTIRTWRLLVALAALSLGVALVACGGDEGEGGEGSASDSTQVADSAATDTAGTDTTEKEEPGVPVSIIETIEGDMIASVGFSATVESEYAVKVYPQAGGLADRLYVEEGDRVVAGQVLVRLDDDDAQLSRENARIEYEKAHNDSVRQAELYGKNLISRDAYEQAIYQANRTRVSAAEAQLRLDRTGIRARVSGVISQRNVELGDRVTASAPIFEMVTMDNLVARVHVPGRHRPGLRVGQPARVTSDMLPDYEIVGKIRRVSPVVDPQSGTVKVTVELNDPESRLAPGMFANVALITERQTEALLAPKEALVYDAGQPYVFVVREDKAHRTRLELGLTNARQVQVLSGLSQGDSIIVVGHEGLRDGAVVRVIVDATAPIPPEEPTAVESDTGDGSAANGSTAT
jgi:membrane fusion protein, multidrug efflux system